MMVCLMMSSSSKTNLCPSSSWRNCRICLPRQARDRPRTGPGGWPICTRTPSLDRGWYYCVDHNDFTSYTHGRNPTEDSSYLNFPSSIPEEVCATSLRNATSIFTCQLSGRLVVKYVCLFLNGFTLLCLEKDPICRSGGRSRRVQELCPAPLLFEGFIIQGPIDLSFCSMRIWKWLVSTD